MHIEAAATHAQNAVLKAELEAMRQQLRAAAIEHTSAVEAETDKADRAEKSRAAVERRLLSVLSVLDVQSTVECPRLLQPKSIPLSQSSSSPPSSSSSLAPSLSSSSSPSAP